MAHYVELGAFDVGLTGKDWIIETVTESSCFVWSPSGEPSSSRDDESLNLP